jgi:hypothetical protein
VKEVKGGYDMNMTIKTWYTKAYPTDDVGLTLDPAVTFADLYHALQAGKCVYATLGGNADSIIRERIFAGLADFLDVDSGHIYNFWLNKKRRY